MSASFEEQYADLILFVQDPTIQIAEQLDSWRKTPEVFERLAPSSAEPLDRVRFLCSIKSLLDSLGRAYGFPHHSSPPQSAGVTDALLMSEMLRILRERYTDTELTLATVAKELQYSSRHLGRLFRRHLNRTFRQCLREARIYNAGRKLLASGGYIKGIAATVGYSSRSHFDADFRAEMGCTPAQFRREHYRTYSHTVAQSTEPTANQPDNESTRLGCSAGL